jgi:hypothetical protein
VNTCSNTVDSCEIQDQNWRLLFDDDELLAYAGDLQAQTRTPCVRVDACIRRMLQQEAVSDDKNIVYEVRLTPHGNLMNCSALVKSSTRPFVQYSLHLYVPY